MNSAEVFIKGKKEHVCQESRTCCCYMLALEPDEDCPIHGDGPWPPRCEICGRFMKREVKQWTDYELTKFR